MRIVPMTPEFAAAIATWRYPEPYGNYSLTGIDPAFFLDPANGYVALVNDAERPADSAERLVNSAGRLVNSAGRLVNSAGRLVNGAGRLIGYRCFGVDGRVPGYDYDDSALDTGGGLRPDLTGAGLGAEAIATGLAYGWERFANAAFRVTVASANARARRVVESLGFRSVARFRASTNGAEYDVLRLDR